MILVKYLKGGERESCNCYYINGKLNSHLEQFIRGKIKWNWKITIIET